MSKGIVMIFLLSLVPFPIPAFPPGENNFFAIAPGAETAGYYPQLFPFLKEVGVGFVRAFPEWANIQPREGEWNFSLADAILKSAKDNGLQILALLHYLAPWVSAKPPSTRAFPIKDIRYWRDFVREVVKRYHKDIKYWEVYNEFPSFSENGTPKDYAELLVNAYEVIKEIAPRCQVGMNWNEFDMSSLQRVIELGASGHFDFVCVHPYAILDRVMKGREEAMLGMMNNFKKMLKLTGQKGDIPLWVTEIGRPARDEPLSEQRQAEALVKAYILCLVQGIERVFWFEGRGPSYGEAGSFGILRWDWTKRPSYYALQTLTRLLGPQPKYLGWYELSKNSHSFVFQGEKGAVLIGWAMKEGDKIHLPPNAKALDITGKPITPQKGRELHLTTAPIFLTNLPQSWVKRATSNREKPFPWQKDYSTADEVSWKLGKDAKDEEEGLYHIDWQDGNNIVEVDGSYVRRTDREKKIFYLEFDVEDSFACLGDRELEITVVARRLDAGQPAGCNIDYESLDGYKTINDWWHIPSEAGWHQHTFSIKDANFANCWGWNFRISVVASPGDIYVKEVKIRKPKITN